MPFPNRVIRLSLYRQLFSRTVLREIKKKGITNILVDTDPRNIDHFFRVILQLQMNNPAYHYTFTSLDVESFDLEDFRYNRVNMTAFRLVDSTSERVRELLREMEEISPIGRAILNQSQVVGTCQSWLRSLIFGQIFPVTLLLFVM